MTEHREVQVPDPAQVVLPKAHAICLNCGAAIAGRYCQSCGQRHDPQVHTVGHFLSAATEDLTHADSRLWVTLFALLFRPGFLTREFFAGRRARYLPPVRLYLVVSVLMFLLASLGSRSDSEVVRIDSGAGTSRVGAPSDCDSLTYSGPWQKLIEPALREGCRKAVADRGRELRQSFLHNIPRAMFLFLPLIAFFMQLLYWHPRRFYVEHLLFLIHNHAFVFVVASLATLVDLLPRQPPGIVGFGVALYMLWYFFRATRVFYEQGKVRSALKMASMAVIYLALATLFITLTALLTVATL